MPFIFNNNYMEAFKELKNWLISSPVLYHYDLDLKLMLEMDASDRVIAGILSQLYLDGEWYPITFFSKTMDLAKCNYEVHNKEMLAIIQLLF
jgi:sporulation-control protein spo0M